MDNRYLPIIGVDIDNVISSTDQKIRELILRLYGVNSSQSDIHNWNYQLSLPIDPAQEAYVFNEFHRFHLRELNVVEGAIDSLLMLSKFYRIYLITGRPPYTREDTQVWLQFNNVPYDKLFFSNGKKDISKKCSFFIEDKGDTAISLAQLGITVFLFDYPWNQDVFLPNIHRVTGWSDVIELALKFNFIPVAYAD